jgi:hypothetical protein
MSCRESHRQAVIFACPTCLWRSICKGWGAPYRWRSRRLCRTVVTFNASPRMATLALSSLSENNERCIRAASPARQTVSRGAALGFTTQRPSAGDRGWRSGRGIKTSAPARIVNVSSAGQQPIECARLLAPLLFGRHGSGPSRRGRPRRHHLHYPQTQSVGLHRRCYFEHARDIGLFAGGNKIRTVGPAEGARRRGTSLVRRPYVGRGPSREHTSPPRSLDRVAVLMVRIRLPPAKSLRTFGS